MYEENTHKQLTMIIICIKRIMLVVFLFHEELPASNLSSESCSSPIFLLAGSFFYCPSPQREHSILFFINGEGAGQAGSLSLNNSMISVHAKSDLPAHIIT